MTKPGLLRPVVIPRHGREVSGKLTERTLRQAGVDIDGFVANL